MVISLREIAKALGAECAGQVDLEIVRACEPSRAGPNDLALAMDKSYVDALAKGQAKAAVLWPGADWQGLGLKAAIFVTRPRFAMAGITSAFDRPPETTPGIHPSAIVDPSASVGTNPSIGAFCVIGPRVKLGDNARVLSHVSISEDAEIGANALLYSGTRIGSRVRIGAGFISHHNATVGSDGFSFVTPEPSAAEEVRRDFKTSGTTRPQAYARICSNASVVIGDNVEIGACSTIDKGTVADTTVGKGTKIDNHAHVGHNAQIGADCLLCGHTGVAGSSVLGDRVILGGQAGVGDHLTLGDDVIITGATAVLSNVPAGRVMMGYPAMKIAQNIEAYKSLRRLPRMVAKLDALYQQVSELGKKS